jgi:hypothetical protein
VFATYFHLFTDPISYLYNTTSSFGFPILPDLLQYVSNFQHYGRITSNGKLIRMACRGAVYHPPVLKLQRDKSSFAEALAGELVGQV